MRFFSSTLATLVLIDETRLVRCDIDLRRQQVVSLRTRPRPIDGDWGSLVELALQQETQRPGHVWVLISDVWSQKISVAGSTVEGLSPLETARALTFEAESFSGISAFDSDLSYVPLGSHEGLRDYWVTQVSRTARDQVAEVIRRRQGKLRAILHPAGLPYSLRSESDQWRRLEIWPGLVLSVSATTNSAGAPQAEYRVLNLERRGTEQAWPEVLAASNTSNIPTAEVVCRLSQEPDLSQWLLLWSRALASGTMSVPQIRPEPKPLGKEVFVAAACGLAALVGGYAYLDHHRLHHQIQQGQAELTQMKGNKETLANLTKEEESLKTKLKQQSAENLKFQRELLAVQTATQAYGTRWQKLLAVLAEQSSAEMVIQEISSSSGQIEIRGKCLGTAAAHDFATHVAEALRPYGWLLSPTQRVVGASELYDYAWTLQEVTPQPPTTSPATLAAVRRRALDQTPAAEPAQPLPASIPPSPGVTP